MKESDIERHLVERTRRIHGECFKLVSPGRVGIPDRLVILPGGEITWVELKAWLGKLSPGQIRMHFRLRELAQDVQVFRSIDQIDKYFPLE